ncbi:addiction module protein [Candidatus Venteria ishoeyi]|uniref:Putative addiction module component n=1 Tax=Candidatus Venteria ishoeyi TaxID=1899563 RepID=A0A1H6F5T3_9GAMM|nr:addiction module protein [Candidatus Venteria ishoeyi]SEH05500.1 Putative addiction module component [Candidatus Venteria ishoeyi]
MTMTIEQLESEALNLPMDSRALLVQRLLTSLERISTQENERLWVEEAEQRYQELLKNPEQIRDAETVFADIRASLK